MSFSIAIKECHTDRMETHSDDPEHSLASLYISSTLSESDFESFRYTKTASFVDFRTFFSAAGPFASNHVMLLALLAIPGTSLPLLPRLLPTADSRPITDLLRRPRDPLLASSALRPRLQKSFPDLGAREDRIAELRVDATSNRTRLMPDPDDGPDPFSSSKLHFFWHTLSGTLLEETMVSTLVLDVFLSNRTFPLRRKDFTLSSIGIVSVSIPKPEPCLRGMPIFSSRLERSLRFRFCLFCEQKFKYSTSSFSRARLSIQNPRA